MAVPQDDERSWDVVIVGAGIAGAIRNPATTVTGRRSRLSRQFNLTWTMLLNGLHAALNGEKSELAELVAHMYQLRNAAKRLIRVPLPSDPGTSAGPTWEFLGSDVVVPRKTAVSR